MLTVYQALYWVLGIRTSSNINLPLRSSKVTKQIITKQRDKNNDHIVQAGRWAPDLGSGSSGKASWSRQYLSQVFWKPVLLSQGFLGSSFLPPMIELLLLCSREACLWRPWLSSANDPPRQVRKLMGLVSLSPCYTWSRAYVATCIHIDQVPFQRALNLGPGLQMWESISTALCTFDSSSGRRTDPRFPWQFER